VAASPLLKTLKKAAISLQSLPPDYALYVDGFGGSAGS
jgi:hypothetical protein